MNSTRSSGVRLLLLDERIAQLARERARRRLGARGAAMRR